MTAPSPRSATLDGLRGVAVLVVLIDHAWPGALPGGFAGVDVFFVLSGFLITGILVGELGRTGRIDLTGFYARRVRRIIPAALLCVVGTWLLYALLLGPAIPDAFRTQATAATFSVSNILSAQTATDYFAADAASSPYLHYWSLGVEEQFYLIWPALLLGVTWLASRMSDPIAARAGRVSSTTIRRWLPIAAIAALGLVSLAMAMRARQTDAFFLLPFRVWELTAGGLLAWLMLDGVARLPLRLRPYRVAGVVAGITALVITFAFAPQLGRWPGPATVLAVCGALLLVAGGDTMPGARLLANRPLRFFGRISYALYLWHWPLLAAAALIVLPQVATPFPVIAVAVAIAIGLATASTVFVEEPIRAARGRFVIRRSAIGTALGSVAIVGIVIVTMSAPLARAVGSSDPLANALSVARTDRERLIADRCYRAITGAAQPRTCFYGAAANADGSPTHDTAGDRPIAVLFGDSHAMYWFPVLDAWARDAGIALVPLVRSGCEPVDGSPPPVAAGRSACIRWLQNAVERVGRLHPLVTFVGTSTGNVIDVGGTIVDPRTDPQAWVHPFAGMLARLRDRSDSVVYFGDVPRPDFNVPDCLGVHRGDPVACARPLVVAQPPALVDAEREATEVAGVDFVDPSAWLCPDGTCTWLVDGRVGWVDDHHITASAALSLRDEMQPILDAISHRADAVRVVP